MLKVQDFAEVADNVSPLGVKVTRWGLREQTPEADVFLTRRESRGAVEWYGMVLVDDEGQDAYAGPCDTAAEVLRWLEGVMP